MKNIIFVLTLLAISLKLSAQDANQFGIIFQANTGSQWVKVPEIPENGTFSYNFKKGFGGGFFFKTRISNRMYYESNISYNRKGFSHPYQNTSGSFNSESNLHFVGFGQTLRINIFNVKGSPLFFNVGIRNERLISNNIGTQKENPNGNAPILTKDYHKWSFSGISSIGYQLNDKLVLDLGMNPDIAPSMKEDQALLRNFTWFLNLNFALISSRKA